MKPARAGQRDRDFRAFAQFRFQLERAAVQGDQVLDNRQAQPRAALGRFMRQRSLTEGLQNAWDFILRNARAGIANRQHLAAVVSVRDRNGDPAALGRELQSVRQQVETDLAERQGGRKISDCSAAAGLAGAPDNAPELN